MDRSAHFSKCRRYRYALWRTWDPLELSVLFIGLNPSTAGANEDDATVRRCIGFAQAWGYGRLAIVNLFAYRTSNPEILRSIDHPIGRANNSWLLRLASQSDLRVAAWGDHGRYLGRDAQIVAWLENLQCLGLTKRGAPRHPLYSPADSRLRILTSSKNA